MTAESLDDLVARTRNAVVALRDERNALQAEVVALREALRKVGIRSHGPERDWLQCDVCNRDGWPRGQDERHATGCLAAPIEKDKGG